MEVKIKHLEQYLRGWGGTHTLIIHMRLGLDFLLQGEKKCVLLWWWIQNKAFSCSAFPPWSTTFLGGHMLIKQQLTKKNPHVTTFPSAYKSAATVNPSKLSRVLIISKCLQTLEKCSEMNHQIIEKHWWEQQTIGCFCPVPHLSVTSFPLHAKR